MYAFLLRGRHLLQSRSWFWRSHVSVANSILRLHAFPHNCFSLVHPHLQRLLPHSKGNGKSFHVQSFSAYEATVYKVFVASFTHGRIFPLSVYFLDVRLIRWRLVITTRCLCSFLMQSSTNLTLSKTLEDSLLTRKSMFCFLQCHDRPIHEIAPHTISPAQTMRTAVQKTVYVCMLTRQLLKPEMCKTRQQPSCQRLCNTKTFVQKVSQQNQQHHRVKTLASLRSRYTMLTRMVSVICLNVIN